MTKRILAILLASTMAVSTATIAYAAEPPIKLTKVDLIATTSDEENKQREIITNYFNYIDSGNWEKWASCYAPSIQSTYLNFALNTTNQNNNLGILTINDVDILSIEKIDSTAAPKYPELQTYYETENVETYLVTLKLKVNEETQYFKNGTQLERGQ